MAMGVEPVLPPTARGKSNGEGSSARGEVASGVIGVAIPRGTDATGTAVLFGQVGRSLTGVEATGGAAGVEIDRLATAVGAGVGSGAGGEASGTGDSVENIITVLEGGRAAAWGKAVNTLPHLVHCTDTP